LKKKDLKKIERLFLEKLDEVIKEGIPEKDILVELNQMELFLKMQSLKIGKGLEYS
jgi:Zn-dependent M16 (insulinase) family peptidase